MSWGVATTSTLQSIIYPIGGGTEAQSPRNGLKCLRAELGFSPPLCNFKTCSSVHCMMLCWLHRSTGAFFPVKGRVPPRPAFYESVGLDQVLVLLAPDLPMNTGFAPGAAGLGSRRFDLANCRPFAFRGVLS